MSRKIKPIKFPRRLNISGHEYKIRMVSTKEINPNHAGECDFSLNEIRILKTLDDNLKWRTLFHEIRHAHHREIGMMQILDSQSIELDCDSFASLLISLKDQRLIKY